MMTLKDKILEAIASSQPLLNVRSADFIDVEADISSMCEGADYAWQLWVWDSDLGLQTKEGVVDLNPAAPPSASKPGVPAALQPIAAAPPKLKSAQLLLAAIEALMRYDNTQELPGADNDENVQAVILVVRDLHRYWRLGSGPENDQFVHPLIVRLRHFVKLAKSSSKYIIGLMPDCEAAQVPPELEADVTVIRHPIPSKDEFKPIISSVQMTDTQTQLTEIEIDQIAEASCGLTRQQAETAYAVSLHRHDGKIKPEVIEEVKNEILNVDGIITRYTGKETFADIGGNDALKEFGLRAMKPKARRRTSRIRAVALVGSPGSGKSLFAKALGNEVGYKSYAVDLGKCKNKWVGESEAGVRRLYARMDSMAPIIAYYDEVNEQISSGGGDDHSVDKAILGSTLVWLNDHTSDVFVVLTSNDVSKMHMALLRPGRVDSIWYVGLPGKEQKKRIWEICMAQYDLDEQDLPSDAGWAGAEINACCRIADALNVSLIEAGKYVIPSSVRVKDQIDALKEWADGRCLDAETGTVYRRDKELPPEATGHLGIGARAKRKVRKL